MKKITIIMPVFNKEKYIRETIESVLNQTLNDPLLRASEIRPYSSGSPFSLPGLSLPCSMSGLAQ